MEKAIKRKKTEISDLVTEYKELINLHSDKVSEYLKNEFYFKQMEKDYHEMDDFEELKRFYFDLGHEFRQFVIEYNIDHELIKEKTINTFLRDKAFLYLLKEKPDDESIEYSDDKAPTINNNKEKEWIESDKENKQDNEQEIIDCLKEEILNDNKKQQQTIDCLKEQIKVNNKNQQRQLKV